MDHSSAPGGGILPIFWGSVLAIGFYALFHFKLIDNSYIRDYFAGHPVEYATTIMFFIGLVSLFMRGMVTLRQSVQLGDKSILGAIPPGGQPLTDCPKLLSKLDLVGRSRRDDPLLRRLRDALERVVRCNSAEGLDGELKYLADREADRVYESYALFRVIIWAIPVLGFLGTVIGITLAIGNLNPAALEDSVGQVVLALRIAFATTTQALSLSIVLMFAKYLVGQTESNLLAKVDRQVEDELVGRFEIASQSGDGQLAAVRRMAETVMRNGEELLKRQAALWQETITEAQKYWSKTAAASAKEVQTALAGALDESLRVHAERLVRGEEEHAERNWQQWQLVQQSLAESAKSAAALQASVCDQVHILHRTVEATGQVARLEEALNRNLSALAGSKNFEETVMSLAAAIHLLSARLGSDVSGGVQLEPRRKSVQAA